MPATPEENAHWIGSSSDEELARRAREGSLPCFAELVGRFETRIFNFLRRRTTVATDAEDLTQDTFMRAWERIGQYEPGRRFSTWLFTVAARLAINHHRQSSREQRRIDRVAEQGRTVTNDDPSDVAANRELGRHAWVLAEQLLTRDQHTLLWLRYAESMPVVEIGRIMGRSSLSIRVQLYRARQTLAQHLAEAPRSRSTQVAAATPPRPAMRQPVAGGLR